MTHKTPPHILTAKEPEDILGSNYELFIEMAGWIRANIGAEDDKFRKNFNSKFNERDRNWYRYKLDELAAHGMYWVEYKGRNQWVTRVKSELDIQFERTASEYDDMPLAQLKKKAREGFRDIG